MIFAENICLWRKDSDGVLMLQVFRDSYYYQKRGQVFIQEKNGDLHQYHPKCIKQIEMRFNPNNFEPFKL